MQHSERPTICSQQTAQKCLAKPVMVAPSLVNFLKQIQIRANVDLEPLIKYTQQILSFMQGGIHKQIKKQLLNPLGLENLDQYQRCIDEVCDKAIADLAQKQDAVDLVRDIEEPLFVGIVQHVFGYIPDSIESFLKDVDVSVKIAEPVQSVKTLLHIQTVFTNMLIAITEQLKTPHKSGLIYDIHNTLSDEAKAYNLEQIAATIAILMIASRTTSETISHIIIKNGTLASPSRAKFSNQKWVAEHFQTLVRFCASTEYLTRVASADVAFDNIQLKQNDSVFIHVPSVNLDKTHFSNCEYTHLDTFPPERHLAFGAGVHRCPGQDLARQLIVTFIPRLYRRFPEVRVAPVSVTFKSSLLAKRVASAEVLLEMNTQGNKK